MMSCSACDLWIVVMSHWVCFLYSYIIATLFSCSSCCFLNCPRDSCCVSSWLTRIGPDHQCRDATDLNFMDKLNQRVQSCRFFLGGADPCKQRSCIPRICHALSSDLSGQWTSLDLIWWEEWWTKIHPWRRALGPVIGFHQLLHPHLHQLYHILRLLVLQLHHAHQLCHVHQLNHALQALHPSLLLSLGHLKLLNLPHHEVQNITKQPAPTGSISILTGKRTKTTTTTKRSTVWPSHVASVNMTKRDSVLAGFDSPRVPTSMQRRQLHIQWPSRRGAASSDAGPSTAMGNWPHEPIRAQAWTAMAWRSMLNIMGTRQWLLLFLYRRDPRPTLKGEAYPLQTEIQQQHRVLHTHIFKEVISTHPSGINRLMVTEVDRYGFQGIVSRNSSSMGLLSCKGRQRRKHRQLGASNPACQLLASLLQHPWSTRRKRLLAQFPTIVWQCWPTRGWPRRSTRIRNGWKGICHCQSWHVIGSKSDSPAGHSSLQRPQQWQGIQCSDPWEAWTPRRWSERQSRPGFHGGRSGPPCQPFGADSPTGTGHGRPIGYRWLGARWHPNLLSRLSNPANSIAFLSLHFDFIDISCLREHIRALR